MKTFNLAGLGLFLVLMSFVLSSCLVDEFCYDNSDCPDSQVCSFETGQSGRCVKKCDADDACSGEQICDGDEQICVAPECGADSACSTGFVCDAGRCRAAGIVECPDDMAAVNNQFCIDLYEASRADATDQHVGYDESIATSRKGVLPWQVASNQVAQTACENAGKDLCTPEQWHTTCVGAEETVYPYGDAYEPETCNGIDAFCNCDAAPRCYFDCGGTFEMLPTGSLSDCRSGYGPYDMSGNMWEHVKGGSDRTIRGGAYNCSDSMQFHRCDYVPGSWTPSARGFRCCSTGTVVSADSSVDVADAP